MKGWAKAMEEVRGGGITYSSLSWRCWKSCHDKVVSGFFDKFLQKKDKQGKSQMGALRVSSWTSVLFNTIIESQFINDLFWTSLKPKGNSPTKCIIWQFCDILIHFWGKIHFVFYCYCRLWHHRLHRLPWLNKQRLNQNEQLNETKDKVKYH